MMTLDSHRKPLTRLLFVMAAVTISVGASADDASSSVDQSSTSSVDSGDDQLTPEAHQAAEHLKAILSDDSEARAMLDGILEGSRLGPGEGWFAASHSQTRFSWEHVLQTYDSDGDEQISRDEFDRRDSDFDRLDRDGDGVLSTADFDWTDSSLTRTPGFMLFFEADRDANGKITPEEFEQLFASLDTDSRGFLALDDVREEFQPAEEDTGNQPRRRGHPSRSTLVLGLQHQEIGSLQPGPELNEPAPDFTLRTLDGGEVTLSEEIGDRPIVLIFGNFTCGPFRSQSGNIEKLYNRYRDRAKFYLVYVREAHPLDGWSMKSNERVGIEIAQPQNDEDRMQVAHTCRAHLGLDIPFLVDTVDDKVGGTYSGMPNRLYLIDHAGRIAFKNSRGPFGFHPRELEQALVLLLGEQEGTQSN